MTKLNWHKWPDEKPSRVEKNTFIVVWRSHDGSIHIDACNFDARIKSFYFEFYNEEGYCSPKFIADGSVTHWLHINELPLPQQGGG